MRSVKNRTEATARGRGPPPRATPRRRLSRRCPSETSGTGAMERLLCCLLGFPEKDAQVLRSLTRLFRPSLSADWAFEVGVSEDCDLLVCDLDDPGGRHAWNSPAPPGLLRAAASATDGGNAGALLLRKPLRGHGPSGIVQVLNAAAAIKHPEIAPAPPPPPEPARRRQPRRRNRRPRPPPSSSRNAAPRPAPAPPPPPAARACPERGGARFVRMGPGGAEMPTQPRRKRQARPSTMTPATQSRLRPPPRPTGSDEGNAAAPPLRQALAPVAGAGPTPGAQPAWASETPHRCRAGPGRCRHQGHPAADALRHRRHAPPRPRQCSPRYAASAAPTRRRCWKRPG